MRVRQHRLVQVGVVVTTLAAAIVWSGSGAGAAPTEVPTPSVEGPITGGSPTGGPWWETPYDLAQYEYVEEEYFLSGTASDRGLICPPSPFGEYGGDMALCVPGGEVHTAPYKVRILVRRPLDPARSNQSALLEWANVSGQMEIEHDWAVDAPMMMREGFVSASVGVQWVGVEGPSQFALKNWAPQRYGSLSQPGDEFSFDIWAQASQALRTGQLTAGLPPDVIIGGGTSQSSYFISNYLKYLAKGDGVFDGYMPTLFPPLAGVPDDVAPTLFVPTEAQWERIYALASPPDGGLLKVWENPGAHVNYYEASQGQAQLEQATGAGPGVWDEDDAGQYGERGTPLISGTLPASGVFGNAMPARYAFRAALHWINIWAQDHKAYREGRLEAGQVRAAPSAPRFNQVAGVTVRDEYGNVTGGVPNPAVKVPVASYDGLLQGSTAPFDPARLALLYPTHATYVSKMQKAVDAIVADGYLLPEDAAEWMTRVKNSPIGK